VEITPSHITVKGAKRELATLTSIYTEPISLAGRRSSFSGEYDIANREWGGLNEERKVLVSVIVREREITKTVKDVPIKLSGLSGDYRVDPPTVLVRFTGPAGQIAAILEDKVELVVNGEKYASQMKKGAKLFRAKLVFPQRPGVEIAVIPGNVRVTRLSN
jgi:hypothetical protein